MELGEHLIELAKKHNVKVIVDGTNLDDLGDYRPGIQALRENGIRSPLVETKFLNLNSGNCKICKVICL